MRIPEGIRPSDDLLDRLTYMKRIRDPATMNFFKATNQNGIKTLWDFSCYEFDYVRKMAAMFAWAHRENTDEWPWPTAQDPKDHFHGGFQRHLLDGLLPKVGLDWGMHSPLDDAPTYIGCPHCGKDVAITLTK